MKKILFSFLVASTVFVIRCAPAGDIGTSFSIPLFAPKPSNVRVLLTDAPHEQMTHVYVNVDHVELWLEKSGIERRLLIGQNMGVVDLLDLQNGVLLPISNIQMPEDVSVRQIRVVLKEDGHSATKISGATCDLRTPSAQHTGIKILLSNPITFESGYSYSLVVDFDAGHSVVQLGNGDCLLKPVLKLKTAEKVPIDVVDDNGNTTTPGEDVGSGDTNDGSGDGFDPSDPSTWPPGVTEENLDDFLN